MATQYRRLIGIVSIAIGVLGPVIIVVCQLVSIPLRLSRNGAIARDTVEKLGAQYPGAVIRGGANFEREVV